MKMNFNIKGGLLAIALASIVIAVGCSPDEVTNGNPLTQTDVNAAFTVSGADENHVTLTGSTDANIKYHTWKWSSTGEFATANPDVAQGEIKGASTMDFVFPTPGTYTVQHRVVGFIGGTNSVTEQTFVVTSYALGPNVIKSPNFENAADWTVLNISNNNAVNWAFNTGSATVSGGDTAYSGKGIYQAVQVEKGNYTIDMHVTGPGSRDTWFEVYANAQAPNQGADYSAGGTLIGLNTWSGCGNSTFDGQLAIIRCSGSGPVVRFAQAGTIYFLIKAGSGQANGVNAITVSDITMRKLG